jgi:hypothetical protein
MSLGLIIGSGILALLCFYFAFSVDEKHFLLKFLFVLFALIFMFMTSVGSAQDNSQVCHIMETNFTVTNATTVSEYDYLCFNTGKSNAVSLIQLTGALFVLVSIYFALYLIKEVFDARNFKLGKK